MARRPRRDGPPPRLPQRRSAVPLLIALAIATALGVWWFRRATPQPEPQAARAAATGVPEPGLRSDEGATFVGASTCVECHAAESQRWRDSMHARRDGRLPTTTLLRRRLHDEPSALHGVTSTFSRDGSRFIVRTDGADGATHDFTAAYTLGVAPLQQYLLPIPGGRYQALELSWDTPRKGAGRPALVPSVPERGDPAGRRPALDRRQPELERQLRRVPLDRPAEGLRRGRRRYATTWSDIGVACEACHGPGSRTWPGRGHEAARPAPARSRRRPRASRSKGRRDVGLRRRDGHRAPGSAATSHVEVETCARCHARRAALADGLPRRPSRSPTRTGRAARRWPVLRRRADPRRGLRVRLVPAEPHVRQRRHLQRLPRPAHAGDRVEPGTLCASCHLPAKFATPAHHHHGRLARRAVRLVSHAGAHVHDRRRAARSQLPRAAAGPHGEDWYSQRLQRLSRGPARGVGRDRGGRLVRHVTRARNRTTAKRSPRVDRWRWTPRPG